MSVPTDPRTFVGQRAGRLGWKVAGFVALGLGLGSAGVLVAVLRSGAEAYLPWTVLAGIAIWWVCFMIGSGSRPAHIRLPVRSSGSTSRLRVEASWRDRPIEVDGPVALGRWLGPLDTATGLVVHLGPRGLRIGGRGHPGHGLPIDGEPVRKVDLELTADELDRLLGALAITADPHRELVVELTRSSQAPGGILRMMGPWFVTLLLVAVIGVVLGTTGLSDTLSATPSGRIALTAISVGVVAVGLVLQIASATRIKRPTYMLRVGSDLVVLRDRRGELISQAPWSHVRATPFAHRIVARHWVGLMPALELHIGDHRALRVGVWDTTNAWPDGVKVTRRGAHWLVGTPQWLPLVEALRDHGALDASGRRAA